MEHKGSYEYHVYIGCASADISSALDLQRQLLQLNGVRCCVRSEQNVHESIQEGVKLSRKCLIILTQNYIVDDWYQIETELILEKAKRRCRYTLFILRSESLDEVPEKLRNFTAIPLTDNKAYVEELKHNLLAVLNVKATLLLEPYNGCGAASGYFYGFLRIALSGFEKGLEDYQREFPDVIKKMLIIMPESCFCPTEIVSLDKIEFTGNFVVTEGNRAGNIQRSYKSSIYKLLDTEQQKHYYFVGELATPLLTIYENYHHGLFGMTLEQLYSEREAFSFNLKEILSHPDNVEFNKNIRLLDWSDPVTKKQDSKELYNFLLPILREEHELERQNKISSLSTAGKSAYSPQTSENEESLPGPTYRPVGFQGIDTGRYLMNKDPRGKCLIVNNIKFDNSRFVLKIRKGAKKDGSDIQNLFKHLKFEVSYHENVTKTELEELLRKMSAADHTNYDAFICCIMTHGDLGMIYTSDDKRYAIRQLVDHFADTKCATLKGKPKMFFIQACQKGDKESASNVRSSSHGGQKWMTKIKRAVKKKTKTLPSSSDADVDTLTDQDIMAPLVVNDTVDVEPFAGDESKLCTCQHKELLVPSHPDFLMSYATLPGAAATRKKKIGSYYIQALCQHLKEGVEINTVLKQVVKTVKEKVKKEGEKKDRLQFPFHLTTGMDRSLYF